MTHLKNDTKIARLASDLYAVLWVGHDALQYTERELLDHLHSYFTEELDHVLDEIEALQIGEVLNLSPFIVAEQIK